MGSVGGSEAGHGDAVDTGSAAPHLAHGLHRAQQRQSGIQSSGDSHHHIGVSYPLQPLLQPGDLGVEDLPAALCQLSGILGNKRISAVGIQNAVRPEWC